MTKAKAVKIDPSRVNPSWKILQMKLTEEKQEKMRQAGSSGQVLKATKRRREFEEKKAEVTATEALVEKKAKYVDDTVVLSQNRTKGEVTKMLAVDCEYVGVGPEGRGDCLARVSVVNEKGLVVYDKYVKPTDRVTDYRTAVSGIRPGNLENGENFLKVQRELYELFKERTIVGHSIQNDFKVLKMTHPTRLIRDTARMQCLRKIVGKSGIPSLKMLAEKILGIDFQTGEHDSVTDARVALRIYQLHKEDIEMELKKYRFNKH